MSGGGGQTLGTLGGKLSFLSKFGEISAKVGGIVAPLPPLPFSNNPEKRIVVFAMLF